MYMGYTDSLTPFSATLRLSCAKVEKDGSKAYTFTSPRKRLPISGGGAPTGAPGAGAAAPGAGGGAGRARGAGAGARGGARGAEATQGAAGRRAAAAA